MPHAQPFPPIGYAPPSSLEAARRRAAPTAPTLDPLAEVERIQTLAANAGVDVSLLEAVAIADRMTPDEFAATLPQGRELVNVTEAARPVVVVEPPPPDPTGKALATIELCGKILRAAGYDGGTIEATTVAGRVTPADLAESLGVELRYG